MTSISKRRAICSHQRLFQLSWCQSISLSLGRSGCLWSKEKRFEISILLSPEQVSLSPIINTYGDFLFSAASAFLPKQCRVYSQHYSRNLVCIHGGRNGLRNLSPVYTGVLLVWAQIAHSIRLSAPDQSLTRFTMLILWNVDCLLSSSLSAQFGAYSLWCVPSSWGEKPRSDHEMTSDMVLSGTLGYWMYIFYVSKIYELLDTVLATLRGKPLTVLHVFHHAVMPFTARSWLERKFETCWIGAVLNATIHVFMYYFFARKTVQRSWDPWWKK